jgi:predicted ATPase
VITRLEIENFKAIKKLSIDLGPLTVLVGPNDSGKSTILQALDVLGRVGSRTTFDGGGVPRIFDTTPSSLANDPRVRVMRFAVDGAVDRRVYRYEIAFDVTTNAVATEKLTWDGRVVIDEPNARASRPHLQQSADAEPSATMIRELASFMVAIEPHQLMVPSGLKAELASNGFGLPSLVGNLMLGLDRDARDRYENALRRFSPNLKSISVRPVNDKENELVYGLLDHRAVAAREVSTGLLMASVYVALAHLPHARFLVEEPENGVHPRAMLMIVDVLRDLARAGRQVVVTTHSPILLNYMDAEDVRVVTRDADGVHVKPITETPHFDERTRDFDLGELWYAVGEDALVSSAS